jgi:hypothetical protein
LSSPNEFKYGGTEVKVEDEECLVLREDDILGVIEKQFRATFTGYPHRRNMKLWPRCSSATKRGAPRSSRA